MVVTKQKILAGAVLILVLSAPGLPADLDKPAGKPKPAADRDLPPFAVKRLGSLEWQFPTHVGDLAYSADGKTLVVSAWTHLYLLDPTTGKELGKVPGQPRALLHTKNGLLAVAATNQIEIWDAVTGKPRHTFPGVIIRSMSCSADGKLLGGIGSLKVENDHEGLKPVAYSAFVWSTATGKPLPAFADGIKGAMSIVLAPDGKGFAWRKADGELCVTNFDLDVTERFQVPAPLLDKNILPNDPNPLQPMYALAFSPDSKTIAVGTKDGVVLVDAATGKKATKCIRKKRAHALENAYTIVFTSAGDKVIVIDQCSPLAVFEVASGKEFASFSSPGGTPAVSPDGKTLAFPGEQSVVFYDLATGKKKTDPDRHGMIFQAALSPDGKTAATASDQIRLWDCATGEVRHVLKHGPGWTPDGLAFTPDGTTLITNEGAGGGAVRFWDVRTGKALDGKLPAAASCRCLALSSDGKTLAFGGDRGIVNLWDLKAGTHITLEVSGKGTIESVSFNGDGSRLVVSAGTFLGFDKIVNDNAFYVLDVPKRKELRRIDTRLRGNPALHATLSPDGKLIATSVGYWDADTGMGIAQPGGWAGGGEIATLVVSPDGKTLALATGGYQPSPDTLARIHLFDAKSLKPMHVLEGHLQRIGSLSFSADSQTLLSASRDGTSVLWDLRKVKR